jgi:hypothetical protein
MVQAWDFMGQHGLGIARRYNSINKGADPKIRDARSLIPAEEVHFADI